MKQNKPPTSSRNTNITDPSGSATKTTKVIGRDTIPSQGPMPKNLKADHMNPKETCSDCGRPVANEDDEAIHDTGACGCKEARSLCWRSWNGNKCCTLSPYDPEGRHP
jgi:hypothetical protein